MSSGFNNMALRWSRDETVVKGCSCGGIEDSDGNVGSDDLPGRGKTLRGFPLNGSCDFLYVVKTSGKSSGPARPVSRLKKSKA